jgi:hypothetical protein
MEPRSRRHQTIYERLISKEIDRLKLANQTDEANGLLTELTDKGLLGELMSLQQFRAKGISHRGDFLRSKATL